MQQQEEMVTARQAISMFRDAGLSEPTFRRRVRAGKIKGHLPEGRKRGALYPRDQVLTAIGEGISGKSAKPKKHMQRLRADLKPATFMKATPEDMPEIADLLEALFSARPNVERWSAWIKRNTEIAYVLKSEGKIVGCGFVIPLREEKILSILAQEATPVTNPDEILLYEPGASVCLYVRSIGVIQTGVGSMQKKYWAEKLILGLTKAMIGLGARGVVIEKIYGRSDTRAGEHAMRSMGFTQIPTTTSHKNFMIDVTISGLESIVRYKKALDTWRAKYEGT